MGYHWPDGAGVSYRASIKLVTSKLTLASIVHGQLIVRLSLSDIAVTLLVASTVHVQSASPYHRRHSTGRVQARLPFRLGLHNRLSGTCAGSIDRYWDLPTFRPVTERSIPRLGAP